jgi:hypothetical protein
MQISRPAVVLVARQSKFGSDRISILSRFLQQAVPDGFDVLPFDAQPSKNATARIALADPFGIFHDREVAVWNPVQPFGDRRVELDAYGVEFGVASKHLVGGISDILATIVDKKRKHVGDRLVGIRRVFGTAWNDEPDLDCDNGQPNCPHPPSPNKASQTADHAIFSNIPAKWHSCRGPAFAGEKLLPAQAVLAYLN